VPMFQPPLESLIRVLGAVPGGLPACLYSRTGLVPMFQPPLESLIRVLGAVPGAAATSRTAAWLGLRVSLTATAMCVVSTVAVAGHCTGGPAAS
jgi:hypothetical protein